MTLESIRIFGQYKYAWFDSRAFVVPENDVCNAFIWRQQDCTRNSVQMVARSLYSHKECENKNNSELQEMIFQKGQNWNDLPIYYRRGRCILRNGAGNLMVDNSIPIFSQDRNYIERHLAVEEG